MSENGDSRPAGGVEQDPIFLRQRGIQMRMQCKPQVASRIEDAFVTVGQLVDAVESDQSLTDHDGIGPATAEVIERWWENRFEREEKMDGGSVERTGAKTATIHFHKSWSPVIGGNGGESA
ncbi:hypothetical protein [Halobellus rufus]|uniref:hypothetical protein n=1 Tax=Halobellus rufus TaxID=1448860 RepID=UPI00067914CF|nr:hypothetical protein [Halobellus rufus]